MFDRRIGFLDEAGLPSDETNRYRSLATLRFLADRAGLGAPWLQTWADFARIVRLYPRILTHPIAWRFIAAQCRRKSAAPRHLQACFCRPRAQAYAGHSGRIDPW